jgi:HlyD family secretion protein
MKPQRMIIFVLAGLALLFLAWRIVMPQFQPTHTLSGYIEGETLYLASPVAGRVAQLGVRRGQRVGGGARLFMVAPQQRAAQGEQATAELQAALAQAEDARKVQRPIELSVLVAQVDAAAATERETRATLTRIEALVRRGIFARARLDDTRAAHDAAVAQLAAARRRVVAATLGAREDQLRAAEARVNQARGALTETSVRMADMSPTAPGPARVEEVFYQRGEWAAANQPIVALIPDDRVWVRFFVPEAEAARYRPGQRVRFRCDGCADDLAATISYVSPRPEFTPPIIYSRDSRDRLVFMVEARPDRPAGLVPGLPVDVFPIESRP